jgi:putative oxidoreductase
VLFAFIIFLIQVNLILTNFGVFDKESRVIKKLLFRTTQESSIFNEATMTALRVVAGILLAALHGSGKVPPGEQLINGVTAMGFPAPTLFAWLAGLAELIGGIFLAVGFLTRLSAFFMAFTMAVAVFGAHAGDAVSVKELGILYFVISLVFLARGAGRWSVDRFIK